METRGKNLIVGFHPEDAHKRDQIDRPSARQKVVDALVSIAGESLDVKFEINDTIERPAPPVAEEDDEPDDSSPPPATASPETPAPTPPQEPAPASQNAPPKAEPPADSFYQDPLIKDALEIFEAKIKT